MAKQLGLPGTEGAPRRAGGNTTGHGGKRPGAGRKRARPGRARGTHRARPFHDRRLPVHVVLRVTPEVGRLRRHKAYAAVRLAMVALVLADALLEKTGGDSLAEVKRNLAATLAAQHAY